MLISETINQAINEQIGHEFASSLQYIAIASHFDTESLPELAGFFYRQADEEHMHAMKFIKYVVDAGGKVVIPAIPASRVDFASPEDAVAHAYEAELKITRLINQLMDAAQNERDYLTSSFLQWFITEQMEEVSTMDTLHKIVKRAGDNVLFVEDYLARRGGQVSDVKVGQAV